MAKKVLVLWHGGCAPENLQPVLIQLKEEWSSQEAEVLLEHVERLTMAGYPESTFDVVLCGVVPPVSFIHSNELLEEIARVMKPSGILTIKEPVVLNVSLPPLRSRDKLISALKFSGFINVQEPSPLILADQNVLHILGESIVNITGQEISIATIQAKTPSYETGASTVLSFGSRISTQQQSISISSDVAQIWSLSANDTMDDDLDLMDSDTLLLEEDLVRPDPESLISSCGLNSGKRKACKNCSCGLAEQLTDDSSSQPIRTVTSSCGNCYLGDAFRCASCPYLGMPAFKSGEQIKLTDRQLNVDQ